jgi:hypothetical protein
MSSDSGALNPRYRMGAGSHTVHLKHMIQSCCSIEHSKAELHENAPKKGCPKSTFSGSLQVGDHEPDISS